MKLTNVHHDGRTVAAIEATDGTYLPVEDIDSAFTGNVQALIRNDQLQELAEIAKHVDRGRFGEPSLQPVITPGKVIGVGLNYRDHAEDLSATQPDEPALFVKLPHTVIGPGDPIPLPKQSSRVTAEGELGLIIGRFAKDVSEDSALSYVAGGVALLDQTAEDILARNPRYLVWSKNYPGFLSIGASMTTIDHLTGRDGDLSHLKVETHHNGSLHRANTVANMLFSPQKIVSFISSIMPLYPGDLICTGTPGAARLSHGDVVEARVSQIGSVTNRAEEAESL